MKNFLKFMFSVKFMFGQFVLFLKKDFFKNNEMSKFYLINLFD